jgi:hypothetical protein
MNLELQVSLRGLLYHFDPERDTEKETCVEIDKLIKKGANPREHNEFPLRLAARNGLLEVVKHLIKKYKADDSVYSYDALSDAIENGRLDVARYLMKRLKSQMFQAKKSTPTF